MMDVLLDGWSLIYQADSPAALHLMTLIANCPPGVRYILALPNSPTQWLPKDVRVYERATDNIAWGRLLWEQRILPAIGKQCGAELLHLTKSTPPLLSSIPVVLSPSDIPLGGIREGLIERARSALAAGGMSRLNALFWPADMPSPHEGRSRVFILPPVVHTGFYTPGKAHGELPEGLDIPETYVLYHGPVDPANLHHLLEVWTWAAGPLGEYYPLLMIGLKGQENREVIPSSVERSGLASNVRVLPPLDPLTLPLVYQRSTAIMHVGGLAPWGNAARNAIASGKAFVAFASKDIDNVVGPAAYLAPEGDARALGAALITVIVEDSLTEQLENAARQRSALWDPSNFSYDLEKAYKNILSP